MRKVSKGKGRGGYPVGSSPTKGRGEGPRNPSQIRQVPARLPVTTHAPLPLHAIEHTPHLRSINCTVSIIHSNRSLPIRSSCNSPLLHSLAHHHLHHQPWPPSPSPLPSSAPAPPWLGSASLPSAPPPSPPSRWDQ